MFRLSLQSELDMSGTESEKVILSCLDNIYFWTLKLFCLFATQRFKPYYLKETKLKTLVL